MISELFGLLASADVKSPIKNRFDINLNKRRIRSISAFSSNSTFYFPVIVSDQCTLEEVTMISRALEKQYAAFVVACISLIPFHRIRADDRGAIEDYLQQFHQNIGISPDADRIVGKTMGFLDSMSESTVCDEDASNFFYSVWKESKEKNTDYVKYMTENYISLNDMFNEAAVDSKTKALKDRFDAVNDELDTWGFIGDADEELFDDDDDEDLEDDIDDSILTEGIGNAVDSVKHTLESVSYNKIMSCSSLTKLRTLEAKLKLLKTKYTKYLNRYKKKYKENQKTGNHSKLRIRFNNMVIGDPKAFMQQYGSYIKVINKRLAACEKRRKELYKRRGEDDKIKAMGENTLTDLTSMDIKAIDFIDESISKLLLAKDSEIFTIDEDADDALKSIDIHYDHNFKSIRNPDKNDPDYEAMKGRLRGPKGDLNPSAATTAHDGKGSTNITYKTFDREVFTNMDMKKSNDMIPTFTKASIGFIVDDTEDVVTRDVMIGVKTYVHKVPTSEMVNELYNAIINKRKFLKFVKFITGEERSLSDLLFGIRELRLDATDSKKAGSQWRIAFKRRKRWAKMALPYITKEYTPNGTVVMTMNEVDYIKDTHGIDLMQNNHCKMIMENDYLLGFVIIDQTNELVHVMYDGHNYQFQQYTYSMLEREQQTTDRMMRELYRSFSR